MLSYLHVAMKHGVIVLDYSDNAIGTMAQTMDGGGHFTAATLRPRVAIADPAQVELAESLHAEAAKACFIAASVNFPIGHEPVTRVAEPASLL
jgi:organic hydroperoxide reductase OsmC/OhrA